jgi:hypothetical protein
MLAEALAARVGVGALKLARGAAELARHQREREALAVVRLHVSTAQPMQPAPGLDGAGAHARFSDRPIQTGPASRRQRILAAGNESGTAARAARATAYPASRRALRSAEAL